MEKQAQDLSTAYITAIMASMFIAQYFLIAKSVETLSDIVIREKYINEKLP